MVHRYSPTVPLLGLAFFLSVSLLFLFNTPYLKSSSLSSTAVLAARFDAGVPSQETKNSIDCSFFPHNDTKFSTALTPFISHHIIATPANAQFCGGITSLDASYFVTSLTDADIFSYYATQLHKANCFSAQKNNTIYFNCSNGSGSVSTYTTLSAYTITFHPS